MMNFVQHVTEVELNPRVISNLVHNAMALGVSECKDVPYSELLNPKKSVQDVMVKVKPLKMHVQHVMEVDTRERKSI